MHDALAMCLGQSFSYLNPIAQGLLQSERPFRQTRRQRFPLQQLHDEKVERFTSGRRSAVRAGSIEHRAFASNVVDGADVGMRELGNCPCFAFESLSAFRGRRETGAEHLDRNRPPETRVVRFVHFAHPAGAKQGQDFVGTETSSPGENHTVALRVHIPSGAIIATRFVRASTTPSAAPPAANRRAPLASREEMRAVRPPSRRPSAARRQPPAIGRHARPRPAQSPRARTTHQ